MNPLAAGYLSSVPPNPGFILFRAPSARVSDLMRRMLTRDRATLTPRFRLLIEPKRQLADEVTNAAITPEIGKLLRTENRLTSVGACILRSLAATAVRSTWIGIQP